MKDKGGGAHPVRDAEPDYEKRIAERDPCEEQAYRDGLMEAHLKVLSFGQAMCQGVNGSQTDAELAAASNALGMAAAALYAMAKGGGKDE